MILPAQDILKRITVEKLVENYEDLDKQVQPNGMDFRLGRVYELALHRHSYGFLKRSGERKLPEATLIAERPGEEVIFHKGNYYLVETAEKLNMPGDLCAFISPRTSVSIVGLLLNTAGIDAGYSGNLHFSALCMAGCKLEIGTRFCQIFFYKLQSPTDKPYNGFYQKLSKFEMDDVRKREAQYHRI